MKSSIRDNVPILNCFVAVYNRHSRVDPLISSRVFYCEIIIGNKISQQSNQKPKGEEYHEIKQEGQDGRQVSPNEG